MAEKQEHAARTDMLNEKGQWVPAIPEPLWIRRWFKSKPYCSQCAVFLRDREDWRNHYGQVHQAGER